MHQLLLLDDQASDIGGIVDELASPPERLCHIFRTTWRGFQPDAVLRDRPSLVLADVSLGDAAPAIAFFQWVRERRSPVPVLAALPAEPCGDLALLAAESADDVMWAPFRREELRHRVVRMCGGSRSCSESALRARLTLEAGLAQLVGEDAAFLRVLEKIPAVARSPGPVLVTGETGTGKELCARAIHHCGPRRNGPFVPVDCGAIPEHLLENELFGHARGAFTDARADQRGLVGMAEGGTLFLDEIDGLSLVAQAKLLRLLQERSYKPLGSDRFREADVNVVAGTNRDLERCVQARTFRADLFFRLNVLRLHLPPLRERPRDIELLANHFLDRLGRGRDGGPRLAFSPAALNKLVLHSWPGNVRELYNVVQRTVAFCGRRIMPSDIELAADDRATSTAATGGFRQARSRAIALFERAYVAELFLRHGGNVSRAAREAGKDRRAFGRLVKKYDLKQPVM